MPLTELQRGYTVSDVARRYRVARSRVRTWIASGRLAAVNTADPLSPPRWIVTADALAAWERQRSAPAPRPVRRRTSRTAHDYYPDE